MQDNAPPRQCTNGKVGASDWHDGQNVLGASEADEEQQRETGTWETTAAENQDANDIWEAGGTDNDAAAPNAEAPAADT